ncbi:hypothetical protein GY45DRAFT_1255252, partial [Cubamyces sp. BRFM 1775]
VIYEMDSKRPRRILVPTLDDWDPSCGCAASTADLDVKKWFVGGRRIKTLWRFPGTEIELQNYYDIVALKKPARRIAVNQENRAIKKLFAHKWNGNILVLKRGRYDKSRVVSITQPEIALINAMVHRKARFLAISLHDSHPSIHRWLEVRGVRYVS